MRKKPLPRTSPQSSTYSSFSSQQTQSSSQWSSSRRTPPVSPGAHIGVSAPTNNPKSHNFLKPLNSNSGSKFGGSAVSESPSTNPKTRQPTPPASLINVLDSLSLDYSVGEAWGAQAASTGSNKGGRGKKSKKKKKSKDYDEERRKARKQRREKRGRKGSADSQSVSNIDSPISSSALSASLSPSISVSPPMTLPSSGAGGGFVKRFRTQSQSPTLVPRESGDDGNINEVEFLTQQVAFMERLKSGNTSSQVTSPTLSRSSMSPTHDLNGSPNLNVQRDSPRIKHFRQKFPSANKKGFDGGLMEDDFVGDSEFEGPIQPVELVKKLDDSFSEETLRPDHIVEIPVQAVSIARMWLSGARQAIDFQKNWKGHDWKDYDHCHHGDPNEDYCQDPNNNNYEDWEAAYNAVDDFGDIYNYENDWAEHYDYEQEWKEYEKSGVWHDYRKRTEEKQEGRNEEQEEENWEAIEITSKVGGGHATNDINDGWDDGKEDAPSPPLIVKAVATFESTDDTELAFGINTLIAVTNEDASGWVYGFIVDNLNLESREVDLDNIQTRSGWFPKSFVVEAEDETEEGQN